jgi:uncharacterized protein (TIGR02687 family)
MSDSRIHFSLQDLFQRHRLIFWYDAVGEWRKSFDAFEEAAVEKILVQNNEFGTKVKILGSPQSEQRFLVYVPAARPPDGENWLLDLLLQGHDFKADRASLAVQEVGLAYEFRSLAEQHVEFFKDAKHTQKFKELVVKEDEAEQLRIKMMAVLARTQVEIEAILLEFLNQAAKEEMFDPVLETFSPHGLVEPFWSAVKRRFGYATLEPSIRDFVIALFRGADPLESQIALSAQGLVFLQRWKDSQQHSQSFQKWSARLEQELNVAQRLQAKGDRQDLGEADAFEVFDKFILHRLCQAFEGERNLDALLRTIQVRRQSFWYPHHRDGYLAIHYAIELRERLARAELTVDSIETGLERYQASWWKMDQAYRLCCYHLRSYGQVNLMEGLENWVTKSYVNNYLLPLADRWSDKVRLMERWTCGSLHSQRQFHELRVRPFLEKGQKIFVIISDALRYEAAADLAERINSENRFTAEVSAMFGGLPSYTQLGMASLLPGKELSVDTENETLSVTVDGRSATGTDNRDKILKFQLDGKGVAIQAENFLALNSKTDGRTLMKENEVIYIFHNVIDKTGDSAGTESKTCDAVEQAFEELVQIIKKVAAINGSNMILTADHGFLFQQDEVHEGDATTLPTATQWINRNRRFAIGMNIQEGKGVKVFSAEQLGLPGEWACAFPTSLGRFPLQGSGKRYVHGGFSLQEIVIPVVHINKSRTDDTGRVQVEIMRVPAKITTGQISFSLFQEKPVTAKRLPRELRVGLYAPDGTSISEVKTVKLDSKDEEARNRETHVLLVLSVASNDFNNQTVEIRLEETLPGTNQTVTYKSHPIKLQKPFASDFDDL